jgi:hypothetical protein
MMKMMMQIPMMKNLNIIKLKELLLWLRYRKTHIMIKIMMRFKTIMMCSSQVKKQKSQSFRAKMKKLNLIKFKKKPQWPSSIIKNIIKQISKRFKLILIISNLVKIQKTQSFCKFLMKLILMMLQLSKQMILCITANILRCGMKL